MTRRDLMNYLEMLPTAIQAGEEELLGAHEALGSLLHERQGHVDAALLREDGPLNGRNAEIREAQARLLCPALENRIWAAERQLARARSKVTGQQAHLKAAVAMARLLGGTDE